MTLRPALDRLGRGFRRMWGWCVARLPRSWRERLQGRLAMEAQAEGRTALAAIASDTIEGDQQVAAQRAAWVENIVYLEGLLNNPESGLPKHTRLDYERLVRQLRRNVRDLDAAEAVRHASPQTLGATPMRFLGPVAPAMGLLGGVRLWMVLAAGWALTLGFLGLQMGLKERIEDQRDEARRVATQNAAAAERWRERSEEYRQAVIDAANVARQAAAALDAERARQAAAAARERRRNREIANVLAGSPEPPDWRLRDDAEAGGGEPPS